MLWDLLQLRYDVQQVIYGVMMFQQIKSPNPGKLIQQGYRTILQSHLPEPGIPADAMRLENALFAPRANVPFPMLPYLERISKHALY
jgi:hypothetical protein